MHLGPARAEVLVGVCPRTTLQGRWRLPERAHVAGEPPGHTSRFQTHGAQALDTCCGRWLLTGLGVVLLRKCGWSRPRAASREQSRSRPLRRRLCSRVPGPGPEHLPGAGLSAGRSGRRGDCRSAPRGAGRGIGCDTRVSGGC